LANLAAASNNNVFEMYVWAGRLAGVGVRGFGVAFLGWVARRAEPLFFVVGRLLWTDGLYYLSRTVFGWDRAWRVMFYDDTLVPHRGPGKQGLYTRADRYSIGSNVYRKGVCPVVISQYAVVHARVA